MNLFGEGFPKEIVKQIEIRQNIHGAGYLDSQPRTADTHLYKNANSAWCRLASGTDVKKISAIQNTNLNTGLNSNILSDSNLARNFVLFNGTSKNDAWNNRKGVGFSLKTDDIFKPHAYTSWGVDNADFGFRPMAGITSVSIKHKNRGSIRAATVNIKAWDKMSFEIIDVLYLRLGFSVLLEWGHSMYYDNNSNLVKNPDNTELMNDFLDGRYNYYKFLDLIRKEQKKNYGNYDAMFGKVTNFHWSYQPDGSYDIILDLISGGDIIESFKVKGNSLQEGTKISATVTEAELKDIDVNDPNADMNKVLSTYAKTSDIANYLNNKSLELQSNGIKATSAWNSPYVLLDSKGNGEVVRVFPPIALSGRANDYFIRLGNFLEFIEDKILYKIKSTNSDSVPFLKIDTNTETNLMHAPNGVMSYDPRVCMARRFVYFYGKLGNVGGGGGTPPVSSSPSLPTLFSVPPSSESPILVTVPPTPQPDVPDSFDPDQEYFSHPYGDPETFVDSNNINKFMVGGALTDVGKIMNIYINFRFILIKLQELSDVEDNSVNLYNFLKEIVANSNGAMAGFTKLNLYIDEASNTLKIIDENPLPSNKAALTHVSKYGTDIDTEKAFFYVNRYYKDTNLTNAAAGFIRDFKFNTELTPDFATMITVSATSQGNVVGENNTALSLLNKGLKDRYKIRIDNKAGSQKHNEDEKDARDDYQKAIDEYNAYYEGLERFLWHLYNNYYIPQEIEDHKQAFSTQQQLYKKITDSYTKLDNIVSNKAGKKSTSKFQPGTGFIPFNLSLTMDGLSGMKIGSKFEIDTEYLPSNYPDTVDFLIKAINHEIKDNQWTTTLESFCIAQGDDSNRTKNESKATKIRSAPPVPHRGGGGRAGGSIGSVPVTNITTCTVDNHHIFASQTYTKTLTSGWCLDRYIISGKTTAGSYNISGDPLIFKKKQIFLHHTAGWLWNGTKGTVDGWNGKAKANSSARTWTSGGPYVIGDVLGATAEVEQLFDDKIFYLTQGNDSFAGGGGNLSNTIGIGIEIQNVGQMKPILDGGGNIKGWASAYGPLPSGHIAKFEARYGAPFGLGHGVSELVDWDGNSLVSQGKKWNGHQYGQQYHPKQLDALKTLIYKLLAKHDGINYDFYGGNTPNGKFKWEGEKTYKQIFPNWTNLGLVSQDPPKNSLDVINSVSGIYTHGAVCPHNKVDSMPTRELVEFLKNL